MAVGSETCGALLPVAGFRLGTVAAGIKKPGRLDLVVMEAAAGSTLAGAFTRNAFCAAPVQICRARLAQLEQPTAEKLYLLTNTGYANAGTGEPGKLNATGLCQRVADLTGVDEGSVYPFSTGVIGEPLPVERISVALPSCVEKLSEAGWRDAAQGILTTDTRPKGVSRQLDIQGQTITITGIAKGSGMIKPDMATMLAYVATDARVSAGLLQKLASMATEVSFNAITVDGDTSTNDCCMLVATGQSGVEISEADDSVLQDFKTILEAVYLQLAQAIVRDGEGATKFVTVEVVQALTAEEAKQVAYTIAHSPLIKTALFASDPNWGRILAAVGRAGLVDLDVNKVALSLNGLLIAEAGALATGYSEADAAREMAGEEITLRVVLGRGKAASRVWTTDLSYDYVKINADYRS